MKNNIVIRQSKNTDLTFLADIEKSAAKKFAVFFADNPDQFKNFSEFDDSTLDHRILVQAHEEKNLYVATDQDIPVGFLAARLMGQMTYIEELSVVFEYQGGGIGKKLMNHFMAQNDYIGLTTDKTIPWNKDFYLKLGFKEVSCDACPNFLKEILLQERKKHSNPENRMAMIYRR